jgi:hypothetical protein
VTIYTKQNNTVDPRHASVESATASDMVSFAETGAGVSGLVATGADASMLNRRGFAVQDHSALGTDQDFSIEKGAAISAGLFASSPAVPIPPRGFFNLAFDQDAMVQDPVWTAVIS